MTDRLQYGTTAKVLHWLIVALLLVQYPLGWLMPDIHRGMKPGAGMTFHISFGITHPGAHRAPLRLAIDPPGTRRKVRCRPGNG